MPNRYVFNRWHHTRFAPLRSRERELSTFARLNCPLDVAHGTLDLGRRIVKQKTARTFLIVTTILFSLGGILGLLPALTSFFLFDAPGSEDNPATILLFCCALTLPVVCLLALLAAWIFYWGKHYRSACGISLLPLLNITGAIAALVWLEIFHGGQFN